MRRLLLVAMLLGGVGCESQRAPLPSADTMNEQMASYIALGDSYTIGEGVAPADRWPVQLARAQSFAPPKIVAKTGWTVGELAAGINAETSPTDEYAVVTLQIGVNDEFRGGTVDGFRLDFERILVRALLFAGDDSARVTAVSIPDYGVTPFGQQREGVAARIDAFNATAKQISEDHGVRWVDVTAVSRAMPQAVVGDGLHPNAAQYEAWTAEISRALGGATP